MEISSNTQALFLNVVCIISKSFNDSYWQKFNFLLKPLYKLKKIMSIQVALKPGFHWSSTACFKTIQWHERVSEAFGISHISA